MSYKYKQILTENNVSTNLNNDDKLPNSKAIRDYVAENSSSTIKLKVVQKESGDYYIIDINDVEVSYNDMVNYMESPNDVIFEKDSNGILFEYMYTSYFHSSFNFDRYIFTYNSGTSSITLRIDVYPSSEASYIVNEVTTILLSTTRIDTEISESAMDSRVPSTLAVKNYVDNKSSKHVVLKCYVNRSTSWGSRVLTDINDNELDIQQLRELMGDGYNFSVIPVDVIDGQEMPVFIMNPIAVINVDEGNGMMVMLQSCFHKIDEDSDFLTSYELTIEISDLTTFYMASLNTNTIPSIEYVDNHIISVINTEV